MLASSVRWAAAIAITLAACLLLACQWSSSPADEDVVATSERWRPELAWVDTIDKAMPIVWDYVADQSGSREERVVRGVDAFVRDRFVHGFSTTPWREDWLLAALGDAPPLKLSVPIDPDAILRHRHAICSQQAIVFMALLERLGIHYAAVRFAWPDPDPYSRGHFAVAAKVDGIWRFYDPDMEAAQAPRIGAIVDGSAAAATYPHKPDLVRRLTYAAAHGGIRVTDLDRHPGPRGHLFQRATRIASDAAPFVLLVLAIVIAPIGGALRTPAGQASRRPDRRTGRRTMARWGKLRRERSTANAGTARFS